MNTKHCSGDGIGDGICEYLLARTQYPRGFYGSGDNRMGVTGSQLRGFLVTSRQ